jgi:uncharacterized protein YeaO (DUF488 family)
MTILIKRAYEKPSPSDGVRILVDRLWPRGIKKEALHIHQWLKDVAPSTELRQWFGHDPARWTEFQHKYSAELDKNHSALEPILDAAKKKTVTLIYGARDTEHNDAVVLRAYLQKHH